MYGIILSALNYLLGFLFKDGVIKYLGYLLWIFFCVKLFGLVISLLPSLSGFSNAISTLNSYPNLVYFLKLVRFDFGVPLVLSAISYRFFIRRIPIVG